MAETIEKAEVSFQEDGMRLDRFLRACFPSHSRSFYENRIKGGNVTVNGKPETKAGRMLSEEDLVEIAFPEPERTEVLPEDLPLDIVYEDSDVIVIDKPKGMVVHPAAGHFTGTLVNALLFHCKDLSGINGVLRPGIVHRIDRDTTGLLVVCKNDRAHVKIAEEIRKHETLRAYVGLVEGRMKEEEGSVDLPIGRSRTDRKKMAVRPDGKEAVTHYRVLRQFEKYTLLEFRLETGRTHQIRVHMADLGHPLVGDPVYGNGKDPFRSEGQMLHAAVLGFHHPTTGELLRFESPLPAYFKEALEKLEKE